MSWRRIGGYWLYAFSHNPARAHTIGADKRYHLQSVNLTRLPSDPPSGGIPQRGASSSPSFIYSSREICPSHLMVKQLHRAHSLFLLHHDVTLEGLYHSVGKLTLCTRLERFWNRFAWNWDVLLCGNPAVDMYDGIKLSAGGELGIGVGEEEWGSGEREVFEDFVSRTDGLVDLVVSRFGDPSTHNESPNKPGEMNPPENGHCWLGSGAYPRPSDGVVFSGVRAVSRASLVRISQWMEWVYTYGDSAYGASEDPTSPRRRKPRKRQRGRLPVRSPGVSSGQQDQSLPPGIPRPLVVGTPPPPQGSDGKSISRLSDSSSPARSEPGSDWSNLKPETFMKYLTLGYGSWLSTTPSSHPRVSALKHESTEQDGSSGDTKEETEEDPTPSEQKKPKAQDTGKFLIGLHDENSDPSGQFPEGNPENRTKGQLDRRILHVHLASSEQETGLSLLLSE